MKIKSIKTELVSENPFAGLTETNARFEPYYICKIISDIALASGKGQTQSAAEDAATENLKRAMAAKVATAMEDYNVRMGAGNLDIS